MSETDIYDLSDQIIVQIIKLNTELKGFDESVWRNKISTILTKKDELDITYTKIISLKDTILDLEKKIADYKPPAEADDPQPLTEEPKKRALKASADKPTEKPVKAKKEVPVTHELTEKNVEKSKEKSIKGKKESPVTPVEAPKETTEKVAEKPKEKPIKVPKTAPVTPEPTEKTAEKPKENSIKVPKASPVEAAEKPTEKVVEKSKEKPVKSKKEVPMATEEHSKEPSMQILKENSIKVKKESPVNPKSSKVVEEAAAAAAPEEPLAASGAPEESVLPISERRKKIPKAIRTIVWNKYIGAGLTSGRCMCCRSELISFNNWHCGHVIAESKGGDLNINNLRPICAPCNQSMGTRSMNEFTSEYFGWTI